MESPAALLYSVPDLSGTGCLYVARRPRNALRCFRGAVSGEPSLADVISVVRLCGFARRFSLCQEHGRPSRPAARAGFCCSLFLSAEAREPQAPRALSTLSGSTLPPASTPAIQQVFDENNIPHNQPCHLDKLTTKPWSRQHRRRRGRQATWPRLTMRRKLVEWRMHMVLGRVVPSTWRARSPAGHLCPWLRLR